MKPQQTITEFETEIRSLVEIVNNPDLADARKSEVEQARISRTNYYQLYSETGKWKYGKKKIDLWKGKYC